MERYRGARRRLFVRAVHPSLRATPFLDPYPMNDLDLELFSFLRVGVLRPFMRIRLRFDVVE
jgi:hypothetical protein